MVAEVCSVYVLRSDGVLELYATEGLNKTAVHLAQLKMGQGLVGTIAASGTVRSTCPTPRRIRPFRYLPETGEEIYHSFLGVPILRTGRALGVLVVQNKAMPQLPRGRGRSARDHRDGSRRDGGDRRVEEDHQARPRTRSDPCRSRSTATAYGEGIGLGYVVLHEPRIVVTNLLNEDTDTGIPAACRGSWGRLRISIDDMLSRRDVSMEGEHRERCLKPIACLPMTSGWVRKLEEAIRNGLTAEAAVEKVQSDTKARMMRLTDPYLRERMHDFDDLANRLLRQLIGLWRPSVSASDFPTDAVIVRPRHGCRRTSRLSARKRPRPGA
ncbi:GAF domain-containing protein [Ensifer canadensis]